MWWVRLAGGWGNIAWTVALIFLGMTVYGSYFELSQHKQHTPATNVLIFILIVAALYFLPLILRGFRGVRDTFYRIFGAVFLPLFIYRLPLHGATTITLKEIDGTFGGFKSKLYIEVFMNQSDWRTIYKSGFNTLHLFEYFTRQEVKNLTVADLGKARTIGFPNSIARADAKRQLVEALHTLRASLDDETPPGLETIEL
jgi:hypothetical protein